MPLRYLILVGRREGPVEPLALQIERRTTLGLVFAIGRVAILANDEDATIPLANDRGAVVGTLFQKEGRTPRIKTFEDAVDPGRSFDLLRILHDRFWGAYVLVALDGDAVSVTRDPSGLLPCLYLTDPDTTVFGSDAALFEEAGLLSPEIDWPALGRLLYANELPQQRMALSRLCDLHAGMSARVLGGAVTISTAWSPWSKAAPAFKVTVESLAARLEDTVDRCIESWAKEHCRIAIAVSGGLDSSVVASSLTLNAGAGVTAITISTDEPRGDESAYARAICEHLGLTLVEGRYEDGAADITKSAGAHLPRPAGRAPTLAYDAVVQREMARLGADGFFTGSGGDNVFYSTNSARPLVDRVLSEGLHWGLFGTARDIARLTGASLWSVLRYAARVPRGPGAKYHWPGDARFLSEDHARANQALPLSHPWLDAPADCLPGKASHVAMILRAQHYLDNYDRRLPFAAVHPLLSQPIIETMLAMPTWLAVEGGVDRAVARKAFSSRFPQLIADRRLKGGPDAFAARLLRSNLARSRERLLDGALCVQGLLDPAALDGALTESGLSRSHDFVRLLLLLDTEAWIERWTH